MLNDSLRNKLIAMRDEDVRVRQELVDAGELGGSYVPRMEEIHVRNAERLQEIIGAHGWPDEPVVGEDGANAAWLIVQHAIGLPRFQRECLVLLRQRGAEGRIPLWHAAYLEDRIAMQEGRPQRYGTQWLDDPVDGRTRPWQLADAERVNELRSEMGLGPLAPIPERGPELAPEQQEEMRRNQRWWEDWLARKGWRE
jgi:hypothetical protein